MTRVKTSRALVALMLLPLLAQAQPIGVVIATKGEVSARAADGSVRALSRRTDIYQGDTLLTGTDGVAQLRLLDDATLTLGRDTEFTFDTYLFDGDTATPDTATMNLARGCMQSVSGQVGAGNVRLDTPFASIAIEGISSPGVSNPATYGAFVSSNELSVISYSGSTVTTNPLGSLQLGLGGAYDSGRVPNGMAPEGLVDAPFGLQDCTPQTNTPLPAGPSADYRVGP